MNTKSAKIIEPQIIEHKVWIFLVRNLFMSLYDVPIKRDIKELVVSKIERNPVGFNKIISARPFYNYDYEF